MMPRATCPTCQVPGEALTGYANKPRFRCGKCGQAFRPDDSKASPPKLACSLWMQSERFASLSTAHLMPDTRNGLLTDCMTWPCYPNKYGGFVYVGTSKDGMPEEFDLQQIISLARTMNLVWLKFDVEASVVDGLPVYAN